MHLFNRKNSCYWRYSGIWYCPLLATLSTKQKSTFLRMALVVNQKKLRFNEFTCCVHSSSCISDRLQPRHRSPIRWDRRIFCTCNQSTKIRAAWACDGANTRWAEDIWNKSIGKINCIMYCAMFVSKSLLLFPS